MAATLTVRVYTSTNAATESASVSGIDLISADNATNSLANRTAHPVAVGTNSYEKHLRVHIDAPPANGVTNFLFWVSTAAMTNVALRAKLAVGTGGASPGTGDSTPSASAMSGDADAYGYTSGAKGTWDSAAYAATNAVTKAALLQLQPNGSAGPGNWTTTTFNYQWDET